MPAPRNTLEVSISTSICYVSVYNWTPTETLKRSQYGNGDDIKSMLDCFNKNTKPVFKSDKDQSYIKFGSAGCNAPRFNIRRGQLVLPGCV